MLTGWGGAVLQLRPTQTAFSAPSTQPATSSLSKESALWSSTCPDLVPLPYVTTFDFFHFNSSPFLRPVNGPSRHGAQQACGFQQRFFLTIFLPAKSSQFMTSELFPQNRLKSGPQAHADGYTQSQGNPHKPLKNPWKIMA